MPTSRRALEPAPKPSPRAPAHEAAIAVNAGTPSSDGDGIDLDALGTERPATVRAVVTAAHAPQSGRWLAEIGFVPGERVTVLTRAWPGGDPLMVRVGHSAFALRRWEARCVFVVPDDDFGSAAGGHR